jgi:ATP-dependent Clp protease ATP-binding subunit ClpA
VLASEEARSLGHNWIGTEHILLGLLRDEKTVAAYVLTALGVGLDPVRVAVTSIVGEGDAERPPDGEIPFTPRAKKVLELSLREARALGSQEIEPEHILLGLARENAGVANRVLDGLGADAQRIRSATLSKRGDAALRRHRKRPGRVFSTETQWQYRIESFEDEQQLGIAALNELGAAGWELVSALPERLGGGLVFKRPQRVIRAQERPDDPAA